MNISPDMYTTLFNGITDAYKKFQEGMQILERIQIESEEIYINQEETH